MGMPPKSNVVKQIVKQETRAGKKQMILALQNALSRETQSAEANVAKLDEMASSLIKNCEEMLQRIKTQAHEQPVC